MTDAYALINELSAELSDACGELTKTSAKVTRLKRERTQANEASTEAQETLTKQLKLDQQSLTEERARSSSLHTQLTDAINEGKDLRAQAREAKQECEKFRKQAKRARPVLDDTRKALKAMKVWNPMTGNRYSQRARRMFRRLDAKGVRANRTASVISIVLEEVGITMKRKPSARLVRMAVKEGGFLSQVQLGSELAHTTCRFISILCNYTDGAVAFGVSSDGTTIKRVNHEGRHITLKTRDSNGEETFKTRVFDLAHAHDHTAETQLEGEMAAGAAIINAYTNSPIYEAVNAPIDTRDFLRKQKWQNMDHAKDGKKKLELVRELKLEAVHDDLGEEEWKEMESVDRFNVTCAVSNEELEEEFGPKLRSVEERKSGRQVLAIRALGATAFNLLSEEEQRRHTDILFGGCMCHKDLNAFKYFVNGLEAMWPSNNGPVLLANKANDAVIRLSEDPNSAAVKNALDSSTRGAMKLVSLAAMLFRNSNEITGYQVLGQNFVELRKRALYPNEIAAGQVHPSEPFPDFQRSRFQTGGRGAVELFSFPEIYIDLIDTVVQAKHSPEPNHMEMNILKGLKDLKTQTELAVVSLYTVCVSIPYMRYARGGGSEHGGIMNLLDTVDVHRGIEPFCQRLADSPDLLLDPSTPANELTLDGRPFANPFVINKVRQRASELPRLKDAIRAAFSGGVTGWDIFTAEFKVGGPIDQLTEEEKEDMHVDGTNDRNESILAFARKQKSSNPAGSISLFAARAMYRQNETEDWIAANTNTDEMTVYAMREARKRDSDGSNKKFRLEEAERLIQKARAQQDRRQKHLEEEAQRRAKLLATPVILETPRLNMLTVKDLTIQMCIHWRVFEDPVLVAIPNKSVLKRKADMLSAVKAAVARYQKR
ncbi:hypothetical protein FB45DRAFT_744511 [Roridomyces roridus]|uniref:Uncharacterized protein n=1 Tax=Roridomyces roridus TaxID=1738132 RepID=A0AAD7BZV4_9AGAR|nr:hypothetical protein FB45DRAFT_744511 [Roridomyces roridus]